MKSEEMYGESVRKNREHYKHACEKHPFFCKEFSRFGGFQIVNLLERARKRLEDSSYTSFDVLICEVYEVYEAYARGAYDDAREEVRDAIAVLERIDDMIAERAGSKE